MAKLVMEYLEDTVKRYPDKIAYRDTKRSLTFSETRAEAMRIANALIQRNLFKKPVAIYLDKSVACFPAIFGVAYSGNFYTVLDTHMPEPRIQRILHTLDPSVVLTDREHADTVAAWKADAEILIYEDIQKLAFDASHVLQVMEKILPTDVLYVLFTSGSTGTPKGVVTPHRAVVDYIDAAADTYHFTSDDIFGNEAPLHFVLSLFDTFIPLKTGSTTCLIPRMYFSFPALLMKYLEEQKVTFIYWVPSELVILANMRALKLADLSSIRMVMFGGEAMPIRQLKMWQEALPEAVFVNNYGSTETTEGAFYYTVNREFQENARLPLGKPVRNYDFLVLDEQNQRVSGKGSGELCIRGNSIAYGYYKDQAQTDRVFTQNPLNPYYEEKVYHTGDLVQFNEFGELEFIGRKDHQIKHMGQRIELGEIEANVSAVAGIEENCCVYNEKKKRIILFYTGTTDEKLLMQALKGCLPVYMLPGRCVHLDSMPHNFHGKIDRAELRLRSESL